MRIGIDASRAFVDSPTGTETYSYQVIRHILALPEARKHEWILYVKRISPSLIPPLKSSLRLASYAVRGGRGSYEDFRLVIAGKWGWSYEGVRGAPVKYGVEDRVVFTGYVGEIEREVLLRSCLAYVQPSITEGFGLPVLEAMAARVPVVSSRGGALEEVTGAAGMLFNPYDVKEMVECLREVVESEGLRRELVKRGRERVKDFSWEKAARQTMKIIASL